MPLTFPTSPSLNEETTTGGRTYKWNGEAWELVGSGIAGPTGPTGPGGGAGISWAAAPISSSATGATGEMAYDADYLYVHTGEHWKRTLLSTFGTYWILAESGEPLDTESGINMRTE